MGRNFETWVLLGKFTFVHIHTCITNKLSIIDNDIQKQKLEKFNLNKQKNELKKLEKKTKIVLKPLENTNKDNKILK